MLTDITDGQTFLAASVNKSNLRTTLLTIIVVIGILVVINVVSAVVVIERTKRSSNDKKKTSAQQNVAGVDSIESVTPDMCKP